MKYNGGRTHRLVMVVNITTIMIIIPITIIQLVIIIIIVMLVVIIVVLIVVILVVIIVVVVRKIARRDYYGGRTPTKSATYHVLTIIKLQMTYLVCIIIIIL